LEEQLNKVFFEKMEIYHEADSFYRGGFDPSGSPLWADLNELYEEAKGVGHFDPNIIQIIGHTQIMDANPIIEEKFWMLDNRQLYILRDDKIEKYVVS